MVALWTVFLFQNPLFNGTEIMDQFKKYPVLRMSQNAGLLNNKLTTNHRFNKQKFLISHLCLQSHSSSNLSFIRYLSSNFIIFRAVN
jgi:hypothetical protein